MGPAVERLRRQIRSREYVVDTEAVAEAMLRRRPELAEVSAGRPSAGSALIADGWDVEEVSARLGHRDSGVTHSIYIHAYESAKRSAARAARLEGMYGDAGAAHRVGETDPLRRRGRG